MSLFYTMIGGRSPGGPSDRNPARTRKAAAIEARTRAERWEDEEGEAARAVGVYDRHSFAIYESIRDFAERSSGGIATATISDIADAVGQTTEMAHRRVEALIRRGAVISTRSASGGTGFVAVTSGYGERRTTRSFG